MSNRISILFILLVITGVVLFKFKQATSDKQAIVQEQVERLMLDFEKRKVAAQTVFENTPSDQLFLPTSKRLFGRDKLRPDFVFFKYDKRDVVAWSHERFPAPFYQEEKNETISFGGGTKGVLKKMSSNISCIIPLYLPKGASEMKWSGSPTDYEIKTENGIKLGYLATIKRVNSVALSWKVLLTLGLFFLFLCYWLLLIARWIREEKGERESGLFLMGGVISFAFFFYAFNFNQSLQGLAYFAGENRDISIGSLSIYAGLLLWVSVIFHRRFVVKNTNISLSRSRGIAWTNYALSALFMLVLVKVIEFSFADWKGTFGDHALDLGGMGLLLISCFIVLAYFFFSHRLASNTHLLDLSRNTRLVLLTTSVIVFGLLVTWLGGDYSGMKLALIVFFYLVLFDFYLDSNTSSLTWLISWILVLSVFLTFVFSYLQIGRSDEILTLFSLLFSLLTILVLVLALANRVFKAVSFSESFPMLKGASLRNKIQLYVIILTLGSFIAIGLVTINSFNKYNAQKNTVNHFSKVELVVKMVEEKLKKNTTIAVAVNQVSRVIGPDINVYSTTGRFSRGRGASTSAFMEPSAFVQFSQPNIKSINATIHYLNKERNTTYVPISNMDGERLVYIEIPYDQDDVEARFELLGFLGNLLTVYVFLMLIISSLSIVIANLITKPISEMGEKLNAVSLDGNDYIEWDGDDEIGHLVDNYNAMIAKLEKNTALLRQSERESAWREMAKQVAHEIKNPLTPMKLSIQHLMRVYEADAEQAAPLIKRMSKTLIVQIESLATIADEFSDFAKMPKANPQRLSLSKLMETVVQLFIAESATNHLTLSTELSKTELFLEADKSHLTRILNNLIKNATQAIPEERAGEVIIRLFERNKTIVIQVEDNGTGIPEDIQPKVFQPNFTTKNSGTGIGLAMTKNMVNGAGGDISFETTIGVGTIFEIVFNL